jgi:hypothetical protein
MLSAMQDTRAANIKLSVSAQGIANTEGRIQGSRLAIDSRQQTFRLALRAGLAHRKIPLGKRNTRTRPALQHE